MLRLKRRWGADHIGFEVGLAASTVQGILNRAGVGRLDRGDRATGRRAGAAVSTREPGRVDPRRYQETRWDPSAAAAGGPGAAATKAKAPRPGWSATATSTPPSMTAAASSTPRSSTTRQAVTAAGFWARAAAWYQANGIDRAARHHRQRLLLPLRTLAPRLHDDRHDRQEDPAVPAPDQRQSRTLPPNPARRMGLHPALAIRDPTHRRVRRVHPLLQSPPSPRSTRMGHPNQHHPGQPPRRAHLGIGLDPPEQGWADLLARTHRTRSVTARRGVCRTASWCGTLLEMRGRG